MLWFILSILSAMFSASDDIIDKFLLSKHKLEPTSYLLLGMLIELPIIPLLFYISYPPLTFYALILGLALAVLDSAALILYNRAMSLEEASRAIPLTYLTALFILPLAYFFFNEIFTFQKYVGILAIVSGAVLISYKGDRGKVSAFVILLLLSSSVLWAFYGIIAKYAFNYFDELSLLAWCYAGYLPVGALLLMVPSARKKFVFRVKKIKKYLKPLVLSSAVDFLAFISYLIALAIGPVSLITALLSTEPFFVLMYTTLFTFFAKHVVKEKVTKLTLFIKIVAICLIFTGVLLIG
jgi:drug/metabolite transporter (DMT)-like permease